MQSVLMRSRGRNLLLRLFLSGRTTRTGTEEEEEEAPRMAGSSRGSGGGAETSFQIIIIWGGGEVLGQLFVKEGKRVYIKLDLKKFIRHLQKVITQQSRKKIKKLFLLVYFTSLSSLTPSNILMRSGRRRERL